MGKLELAFDVLARDAASKPLKNVGDQAEKTGKQVEHGAGRGSKAFGLLGRTLADSSNGALGPISELTNKIGVFNEALEQGGRSKAASRLFGAGLAATAAGGFISTLHSNETEALHQLQASIETTGHSYEDYADQIEKATSKGEKFGYLTTQTLDALNRLTITTHDPAEALVALSAAEDVAAAKHITLSKAAEVIGLAYNGSARSGKQFGVVLENIGAVGQKLTAAQARSAAATDAVGKAQTTYSEKLELWNQSSHKTLAQAYALRDAHTHLVDAQRKAATAADALKRAQQQANTASEAGARNVAKVAAVVKGQGEAAANSFGGELRKLRAEIEDTLGRQGSLGRSLDIIGPSLAGIGGLAQVGFFGKLGGGLKTLGTKFGILRDVEVATSAEGAAAIEANAAAGSAAMAAEGDVALVTAGKFGKLAALGRTGGLIGVMLAVADEAHKLSQDVIDDGSNRGGLIGFFEKAAGVAEKFTVDMSLAGNAVQSFKSLTGGNPFGGKFFDGGSLHLFGGDDKPKTPKLLTVDPKLIGDSNAGDDKLAMQRLAHTLTAAKPTAKKAGKDSGDEYLKALLAQIAGQTAADNLKKAAEDQAQGVIDAISAKFEAAKSRLQGLVSASLNLRQQVTSALQGGSALTDVFSGPDLNANGAFGHQNSFGRVQAFLQKRLAQERRFVLELRALIKQGLDPSLVAQIASAGVDGGQRIAEAILSGGRSGIGQVNSLERQIASLAGSTGKTVADQHYAQQIAVARNQTAVLSEQLKRANNHLAAIEKQSSSGATDTRTRASLAGV